MVRIDVKRVLILWGGYVRFTDCRGYPTMQSFMRESPEMRTQQRYLARLDDETLAKVDQQVRKLGEDSVQFKLIFLRYVNGLDNRECWRKLSLNQFTYKKEKELAERFIEGALAGSEIRLFF